MIDSIELRTKNTFKQIYDNMNLKKILGTNAEEASDLKVDIKEKMAQ